jgi:hypothetical protein
VPVDVAGEERGEFAGNVRGANDVGGSREGVVSWSDAGAFDTVMHAEQPHVRWRIRPVRLRDKLGEAMAHIVSLVRESGQCDAQSLDRYHHRPRLGEDVQVGVSGEAQVRQSRSLVIPRDDEDGNPHVGDAPQRLERLERQRRDHGRAIEYITGMDDRVDFSGERRRERALVIRKEIVTAPPPFHARSRGKVKAEVSVREQQESGDASHVSEV